MLFLIILSVTAYNTKFNQFRVDLFDDTLNNFQNLIKVHEQLSNKYNEIKKLSSNYLDKSYQLNKCINDYNNLMSDFNSLNNEYNKISNGTLIKKYKSTISLLNTIIKYLIILIGILISVVYIEIYIYSYKR